MALSNKERVMSVLYDCYLVNEETGEKEPIPTGRKVINEIGEVTKSKFADKPEYAKTKSKKYFHLITGFETNLKERLGISHPDLGRLLMLFTYASYRKDSKLYLRTDNHILLDTKLLGKILKLNRKQVSNFKNNMINKEMLYEDEIGLYFKDDLIIKGNMTKREKNSLTYYRIYSKTIRELYNLFADEDNIKSVKPLGVLLCMIPYIRTLEREDVKEGKRSSNNILVLSEYDIEANRYEPISQNQLAKKMKVSKTTLIKDIKDLNLAVKEATGEFLIYKFKISPMGIKNFKYTNEAIFINPRYTYSSDEASDEYKRLIEGIKTLTSDNILIGDLL